MADIVPLLWKTECDDGDESKSDGKDDGDDSFDKYVKSSELEIDMGDYEDLLLSRSDYYVQLFECKRGRLILVAMMELKGQEGKSMIFINFETGRMIGKSSAQIVQYMKPLYYRKDDLEYVVCCQHPPQSRGEGGKKLVFIELDSFNIDFSVDMGNVGMNFRVLCNVNGRIFVATNNTLCYYVVEKGGGHFDDKIGIVKGQNAHSDIICMCLLRTKPLIVVAGGSNQGRIKIFNYDIVKVNNIPEVHRSVIGTVASVIIEGKELLVTGSWDGTIGIVDCENEKRPKMVRRLAVGGAWLKRVIVQDDQYVISMTNSGKKVIIHDLKNESNDRCQDFVLVRRASDIVCMSKISQSRKHHFFVYLSDGDDKVRFPVTVYRRLTSLDSQYEEDIRERKEFITIDLDLSDDDDERKNLFELFHITFSSFQNENPRIILPKILLMI